MRIVKFRGKRKLNGKWVFGSYIAVGNDWCHIVPLGTEIEDLQHEKIRVITDTVCEFTGLKDKVNNDIYECDIITDGEVNYEVKYVWSGFRILKGRQYVDFIEDLKKMEVIGNIFDNPDLVNDLIVKDKNALS
ncbi:YopX family protein [Chryseobacterium cucumeris]|uniref:YopX family protein n=1 Tax=Chryseobacterium cucumeris TaxID=1813611 RepID=UPI0032080E3A